MVKNEEDFTNLDSAFHYFNVAYRMNNQYVQAIHNIGLCYEIRGQIEMAKNKYKEAINLNNNFTPSLDA